MLSPRQRRRRREALDMASVRCVWTGKRTPFLLQVTFIGDRHTYVGLVPICQHPFEARRLAGVAATATSLLGALLQRASVYPLLYCLLSAGIPFQQRFCRKKRPVCVCLPGFEDTRYARARDRPLTFKWGAVRKLLLLSSSMAWNTHPLPFPSGSRIQVTL